MKKNSKFTGSKVNAANFNWKKVISPTFVQVHFEGENQIRTINLDRVGMWLGILQCLVSAFAYIVQ